MLGHSLWFSLSLSLYLLFYCNQAFSTEWWEREVEAMSTNFLEYIKLA